MTTLDIVFCVILGFLALRGIWRGLVREVASILGLLLGFFVANTYHAEAVPYLEKWLAASGLASLAAYLGLFLGTVAAVFIVATLIRKILRVIMLGWLDRIGGGALGLLKGTLMCSIIVLALTAFLPSKSELLLESRIVPHINSFNTFLAEALPQDMRENFFKRSQELKKEWEARLLQQLSKIKESNASKE